MGIDQATFYPLMASPHKRDALERRFNRVDMSRERGFYDVILKEVVRGRLPGVHRLVLLPWRPHDRRVHHRL